MSTDQGWPFRVKIAQALGWIALEHKGAGLWMGLPPDGDDPKEVPAFGASWCSTGPVLSELQILLGPEYDVDNEGGLVFARKWGCKLGKDRTGDTITYGETGPEAVGNLILKLYEMGEI